MNTQRAISADTARRTALDECELKIVTAFRRGLEATCSIARELNKILRNELYKAKTSEFKDYLREYLKIDERSFRRIIAISQTVDQLKEAGLELPANESQAAELSRLQPPLRPKVWLELITKAEREEKNLTLDEVRRAVESVESLPVAESATVEVEMEMEDSDNGEEPVAAKPRQTKVIEAELILTEKGDAALQRIRKVCGAEVADDIASGNKAITEREIKAWAEYDDEMMQNLVYYIMDQNWPLAKAVSFENRIAQVQDSTDVADLILIASARGGKATIKHDRAKITIELAK